MIGVIDYEAGNLQSVGNALDHLGLSWRLVDGPGGLPNCDRLILPGVGHFGSAMARLEAAKLSEAIRSSVQAGTPLLGVCLGAQLLLDRSEEAPSEGLGLIPGSVVRLDTGTVPHMGWNGVRGADGAVLFDGGGRHRYFYFAHSYVCVPDDDATVAATTDCDGRTFCVALQRNRVFGVQFHPEKSANAGLDLLRRFSEC